MGSKRQARQAERCQSQKQPHRIASLATGDSKSNALRSPRWLRHPAALEACGVIRSRRAPQPRNLLGLGARTLQAQVLQVLKVVHAQQVTVAHLNGTTARRKASHELSLLQRAAKLHSPGGQQTARASVGCDSGYIVFYSVVLYSDFH